MELPRSIVRARGVHISNPDKERVGMWSRGYLLQVVSKNLERKSVEDVSIVEESSKFFIDELLRLLSIWEIEFDIALKPGVALKFTRLYIRWHQ